MGASLETGVLGLAVQDSRGSGRPGRKGTLLVPWLAWVGAGGRGGRSHQPRTALSHKLTDPAPLSEL